MKDGWLWLSILKTTASPSPISTTPAFSPGPQMTRGPSVGSVFSQIFDDLYEQCSLHIAEKTPSSVRLGRAAENGFATRELVRAEAHLGGEATR